MAAHRYAVGQMVYLMPGPYNRSSAPAGSYRITRLLPEEQGDLQYRIKSIGDAHERVAKESQLDRSQSAT